MRPNFSAVAVEPSAINLSNIVQERPRPSKRFWQIAQAHIATNRIGIQPCLNVRAILPKQVEISRPQGFGVWLMFWFENGFSGAIKTR